MTICCRQGVQVLVRGALQVSSEESSRSSSDQSSSKTNSRATPHLPIPPGRRRIQPCKRQQPRRRWRRPHSSPSAYPPAPAPPPGRAARAASSAAPPAAPGSVAAPRWAQRTVVIPPQSRGCHIITQKIMHAIRSDLAEFKCGLAHLFYGGTEKFHG